MADEKFNVKDPSLLPVLEKIVAEVQTKPEWNEKAIVIKYYTRNMDSYTFFYVHEEKTETHKGLFKKHLKKTLGKPLFEVYRRNNDLIVSFGDRALQSTILKFLHEYALRENINDIHLNDNLRLPYFKE